MNSLQLYEGKKQQIIQEWKEKIRNKEQIVLNKSISNLFRYRKNNASRLNVKDFNKVIHVDPINLLVEVEGMTTYEDLVNETLKYNCMPQVVPELKSITIGGAFTGVGIESSSFKYGLVHETIKEIEVLLPSGEIVIANRTNDYKDLFFAFPNSYGTLGYVLKLKTNLEKVKQYIKLTHRKFISQKEFWSSLEQLCKEQRNKKEISFIDGVIFNESEMIITLGELIEKAPYLSNYKKLKIYYKSLKEKQEDYLTIKDYIWRWDTDWFWCSKHFGVQNKLLRLFIPKSLLNSKNYWKIRAWNGKYRFTEKFPSKKKRESIIQDVETTINKTEEFLTFFHKEIGIKPIWICPLQSQEQKTVYPLYKLDPKKLYINFGFWDTVPTTYEEGYYNKKIEQKLKELKGKKSLYSNVFYTEEEFWKNYNKKEYFKIKKKYDPHKVLKNLYEKVVREKA